MLAGLVATIGIGAFGATEASAAISVSNVQATPASVQAGANADLALSFDLAGGQLKDLVIHLPPGLVGNPLATPTCTEAQLNADACPAASDVGDISNDVQIGGLAPQTATGQVFNVVPRQGEPARFGFVLNAPPADKIVLQSPASLRPGDFGLDTTLNDLPTTATVAGIQLPITITGVDLNLKGQVGSPPQGFLRFPTSCGTNTIKVDATAYDASTGSAQGAFQTTNCEALPFSPQFGATIKQSGPPTKPVEISTSIKQTIQEAGLKRATVTLPSELGPNSVAFNSTCAETDFMAGACPPASIVGSARAASPLQAQALTGPVVLITPPTGGLPVLGLDLRGALALKLKGQIGLDATKPGALRTTVTFDNLPDIPISDFSLTFGGGEGGLNLAARNPCKPPAFKFDTSFLSHAGLTVDSTTEAKATCKGAGKKPKAKLRLKLPKSGDPALKLKLKAGAARIKSATLKLPKPLSLDLNGKRHMRGIDVGPGAVAARAKLRSLSLKVKGKGAKRLTVRIGDGALVAAGGSKLKKPFKLLVKDVDGKRTKLSVKAR